ncbi:hypothetical protein D3C76_1122680 [compost metagenome]
MGGTDHQMANLATFDTIGQVIASQQCGGRDDHGAKLEGGQHGFPQGDVVAKHQQDALATAHAKGTQVVGHLVGARGQLLEAVALLAAVFFDDPQGVGLVAFGHGIEVIQRPVEFTQLRPLEVPCGSGVVGTVGQQEITSFDEGLAVAVHWSLHRSRGRSAR